MAGNMNISYNTGGAHAMAGYIKGIQDIVETDLFLGSAVSVIQAQLTNSFDLYADGVASTNRAMYHHVYDYDGRAQYGGSSTVGDPRYRLWAHASAGNGRTRIASFKFLPSKRPVPRDPRVLQPPYSANTGVHIFVWKAPVFEYGIEVTIAPTIAKRLIFVNYQGGVQFGNFTVRFVPGRGQNTRAFTNLYYGWWKTMAGKEFKRAGLDRIMADNIANEKGIAMATTKAAKKPFSIMTGRNNNQEFKRAQRAAHTHMKRLSGRYIDDAARRRMILYGY